jgi:hypothetical protein
MKAKNNKSVHFIEVRKKKERITFALSYKIEQEEERTFFYLFDSL